MTFIYPILAVFALKVYTSTERAAWSLCLLRTEHPQVENVSTELGLNALFSSLSKLQV